MVRALVAVAIVLGIPALQTQPDAARVLADMRQALGGEAALAAVRSFSLSGAESIKIDDRVMKALGPDVALAHVESSKWDAPVMSVNVDWISVLPDSSVRVRRAASSWDRDSETDGFRGDALIYRRDSPDPVSPLQGATAAERAAHSAQAVRHWKHEFSMLAIALVGQPAFAPLDASYDGQRSVAGRPCDVLQLRSSDGYAATLAVDAATHLPVSVSWMGPAGFMVASTSRTSPIVGVPSRVPGASSIPPLDAKSPEPQQFPTGTSAAGDPTASQMEYLIQFDDFKVVDGLTWPHRFTAKVGNLYVQTTRVTKYKLNPKIDPKLFDPARR